MTDPNEESGMASNTIKFIITIFIALMLAVVGVRSIKKSRGRLSQRNSSAPLGPPPSPYQDLPPPPQQVLPPPPQNIFEDHFQTNEFPEAFQDSFPVRDF